MTLAQSSNEGIAAAARSLGVVVTTLRTWLHRAQVPSSYSGTLTPSEKNELAQLRCEVSVLQAYPSRRDGAGRESALPDQLFNSKRLIHI